MLLFIHHFGLGPSVRTLGIEYSIAVEQVESIEQSVSAPLLAELISIFCVDLMTLHNIQ